MHAFHHTETQKHTHLSPCPKSEGDRLHGGLSCYTRNNLTNTVTSRVLAAERRRRKDHDNDGDGGDDGNDHDDNEDKLVISD